MRNVQLIYRPKGPGWVATSPEAPDYLAYADTLAEAIALAHEGIAFHFDVEQSELMIVDSVNTPPGVVLSNNTTGISGVAVSGAFAVSPNIGEVVVRSAPVLIPENVTAEIRVAPVSAA